MTVERKIALFGLDRFSSSQPVPTGFEEDLLLGLISARKRHVSTKSEKSIRVKDTDLDGHVIFDRTISGLDINNARIDNAQDGLFGRIFRISYRYTPSQI